MFIERQSQRLLSLLGVAASALIAGCTTQAPYEPSANEFVVHAVLNAAERKQYVLVEYSNGTPAEQIPVRNAVVTLTSSSGRVYVARSVLDTVRGYFSPGGPPPTLYLRFVYLIDLDVYADSLVPGATYSLKVRSNGTDITGETTIPEGSGVGTASIPVDTFYRSRDTLSLAWAKTTGARSHQFVLSESGVARHSEFVDQDVSVPGTATMLNVRTDRQVPMFVPDVRYDVSVLAVDANYYNYFSNENGSWQSSTVGAGALRGAIGVFGSVAPVLRRRFVVK